MESDITQSAAFYKTWAWAENHRKQLALGAAAILVLGGVLGFYLWQQHRTEVAASEALSRVATQSSVAGQAAAPEEFQKIAAEFPGTSGAERALLIAGARFFADEKYAEAQAQFEKFMGEFRASDFAGQAALGIAASLEAQGKTEEALNSYKQITERRATDSVAPLAKLSLARLYEAQGNLPLARDTYQQLARPDYGAIGQEAGMHLQNLMEKNPQLAETTPSPATIEAVVSTNAPASDPQ